MDSLSKALTDPVKQGLASYHRNDEDGELRLAIPGLSLKSMIGTAFHPLRRASRDNILMARSVAKALSRLATVATDKSLPVLREHAKLLESELKKAGLREEDIDTVRDCLGGFEK